MSKLHTAHFEIIGPNRCRHTLHFARREMLESFAQASRETARNLPSKQMTVYESEDVVILERNIA